VEAQQNSEHWDRMAHGDDPEWKSDEMRSQSKEAPRHELGAQHELFPPEGSKSVGVGPGDDYSNEPSEDRDYETSESPVEIAARIAKETALIAAKVRAFQAKMEGRMSPVSGPISPENAKGNKDIRNFFEKSPMKKRDTEEDTAEPNQAPATAEA
jgi:hypothetical protein|tara:strand:- start:1926 stop:2390 length:465 start_codon:yes stop_codon:yes gene_type:complete